MRRLLKWLGYLVLTLAFLAVCGVVAVYAVSEYELCRSCEAPPVSLSLPDDPESIEEGRRLAVFRSEGSKPASLVHP